MTAMKNLKIAYGTWPSRTIDITFPKAHGIPGYRGAIERICEEATKSISDGVKVIILSDRNIGPDRVPLSALVACGAVHHHLVATKKRAKIALMVDTGEAREVHHLCVLVGYGADAICPYLAFEIIHKVAREKLYVHTLLKNSRYSHCP
jgi:glutamate synthase (NADPH/NADH)